MGERGDPGSHGKAAIKTQKQMAVVAVVFQFMAFTASRWI